ncbi:DMT family transporter [Candidatus Woesearchaeota archaeon]|nr:DMT family transporter [Candidatus Woesearchaeota archaeon]
MIEKRGLLLVFLTAIISGFSIFINKFGIVGINSDIFTFSKNTVVAVFLFAVILSLGNFKELKKLTKKQWLLLASIGLIGGSVPFLLFFRGLQMTSSAMGSLIHKTMFVYVGIFAVIFLKEKLSKKIIIPALLLLIGNLIILKISAFSFNYGDLLILIAALFWAAENTLSKHVLKELSGNTVAFGRMFFGSLFILIYLVATKEIFLMKSLNVEQMTWIIATSLILLGYVLAWYNGLKHVDVTLATSVLLLGSPVTTTLNYLFLNAALTVNDVVGGVFLVAGIIAMILLSKRIQSTTSTAYP